MSENYFESLTFVVQWRYKGYKTLWCTEAAFARLSMAEDYIKEWQTKEQRREFRIIEMF